MPIERDTIGRKYTERQIIRQIGEPTEEDLQEAHRVWAELREAASLKGKASTIVAAATLQLDRSGLPWNPYDPFYSDAWLRSKKHRYKSLDWYARELLVRHLHMVRYRERGDVDAAIAEGIALGVMFNEFCVVADKVQKDSNYGKRPREEVAHRHELWRKQATEMLARTNLSIRAIAGRIALKHDVPFETVRSALKLKKMG